MRLFDDTERIIVLPQHPRGRGRLPGCARYGRVDERIIQTDAPTPPIPRYRGCQPGCTCLRCILAIRDWHYQFRACRRFRVPR